MSRTTPDPVFAAAARAEVERRVRAAAGAPAATTGRPRRRWTVELVAVAGVAVLVAGVAVGVTALRPAFLPDAAPAGGVTQSPAPMTEEPAPLRTGPAPIVPTTAPTTTAPTTPPPTTEAPTTPPPTAPPTGAALIGPTGAQVRSSAEVRAWALSLGYGDVWAEQAVLDTSCMADHGFRYDPEFARDGGLAAQRVGLTAAQYSAFQDALWGPQTDLPYDWTTAGCHGRSVHLTGQDGNH